MVRINPPSGVILHIPHASKIIPPEVRPTLPVSDEALEVELLRMTDAYTDELFASAHPGTRTITHPVSRLVLDPERFRSDADEPMSARGMGAIYTCMSGGGTLRAPVSTLDRERLLAQWYDPHHQRLSDAADEALREHGRCLIVDCHSFPSTPLPCDLDRHPERPAICIGTDPYHTPAELTASTLEFFHQRGFSVQLDTPYSGTIVPQNHYQRDQRVRSIMIELNRAFYMDESTGRRNDGFDHVRQVVHELIGALEATI